MATAKRAPRVTAYEIEKLAKALSHLNKLENEVYVSTRGGVRLVLTGDLVLLAKYDSDLDEYYVEL